MGALGGINSTTSVVESSEVGAAGGVASLDAGGMMPSTQLPMDNYILVKSASDLPAPVGGVITIPANTAVVFNTFLTTSDRFVLGDNVLFDTINDRKDGINYTGTGVLFTVTDARITIQNMNINAATGTLINATNAAKDKPIRIVTNHTGNVSDWGFVDGFSNVIIEANGFANYGQGAVTKNYARMFWNDNKIFGWKQEVVAIMLTLEGTCGETIIGINVFHPKTNETAFEIDAAATVSNLTLAGNAFVGIGAGGTYLGPDLLADLENVNYTGIANGGVAEFSDIVAGIELKTSVAASTDVADGSYTLLAGTTVSTNAFRYSQSANMTVLSATSQDIEKKITADVNVIKDGGADKEYDFALFLNGMIIPESEQTNVTVSAAGNIVITLQTRETISPTDTVDVRVAGNGTTEDITASVHLII